MMGKSKDDVKIVLVAQEINASYNSQDKRD